MRPRAVPCLFEEGLIQALLRVKNIAQNQILQGTARLRTLADSLHDFGAIGPPPSQRRQHRKGRRVRGQRLELPALQQPRKVQQPIPVVVRLLQQQIHAPHIGDRAVGAVPVLPALVHRHLEQHRPRPVGMRLRVPPQELQLVPQLLRLGLGAAGRLVFEQNEDIPHLAGRCVHDLANQQPVCEIPAQRLIVHEVDLGQLELFPRQPRARPRRQDFADERVDPIGIAAVLREQGVADLPVGLEDVCVGHAGLLRRAAGAGL